MSRSSTTVAFRLPNALADHLKQWADMRSKTVSTVIRECVEAGIGSPPEPEPPSSTAVGGDWGDQWQ